MVDAYNAELREAGGFVGDRANQKAFHSILHHWRERLRDTGEDPLGDRATEDIGKRRLEQALLHGDAEAAGLVLTAIEEFAQELVRVCHRLLALPEWRDTNSIAVGGGFRASRVGELAIGRADVLLKSEREVGLRTIHHDPDEAGLIGAACLIPPEQAAGAPVLGVDIGGSKIRAGLVAGTGKGMRTLDSEVWHHAEEGADRDRVVLRMAEMLRAVIARAQDQGRMPAPFVGVGCPGVIRPDGAIERGGQNLPGDWEAPDFRLPARLQDLLPPLGDRRPAVLLHNDAVAQGLSELPWMQDVSRWGILTIGTGLGNARFTNVS